METAREATQTLCASMNSFKFLKRVEEKFKCKAVSRTLVLIFKESLHNAFERQAE